VHPSTNASYDLRLAGNFGSTPFVKGDFFCSLKSKRRRTPLPTASWQKRDRLREAPSHCFREIAPSPVENGPPIYFFLPGLLSLTSNRHAHPRDGCSTEKEVVAFLPGAETWELACLARCAGAGHRNVFLKNRRNIRKNGCFALN